MRYRSLIMILLGAALAACTSETTEALDDAGSRYVRSDGAGEPVSFSTYTGRGKQTRADGTYFVDGQEKTTIPSQRWVGIFAWSQGTNKWSKDFMDKGTWADGTTPVTADFMFNQPAQAQAANNGSASLTYNPVRYWPRDTTRRFTFFAYYPFVNINRVADDQDRGDTTAMGITVPTDQRQGGVSTARLRDKGVNKFHFKVKENVKDMIDFMVSDYIYDYNGTGKDAVTLNFRHALSQVQVSVKISDDMINNGAEISLTGIELSGVYGEGDLTVVPDDAGEVTMTWAIDSDKGTRTFSTDESATLGSNSDYDLVMLMIPQKVDNIKITVKYNLNFYDEDSEGNKTLLYSYKDITVDMPMTDKAEEWGAGRRYVYNVLQTTSEVLISTDVMPWEETFNTYPIDM